MVSKRKKVNIKKHKRRTRNGLTIVRQHKRKILKSKKLKTLPKKLRWGISEVKSIPLYKIKPTEFILNYENLEDALDTLNTIMEALANGEEIDPITVVKHPQKDEFYLKDGHHRLLVYKLMGINRISAEIEDPNVYNPNEYESYALYWESQADLIESTKAADWNPDYLLEDPTSEQLNLINEYYEKEKKKNQN